MGAICSLWRNTPVGWAVRMLKMFGTLGWLFSPTFPGKQHFLLNILTPLAWLLAYPPLQSIPQHSGGYAATLHFGSLGSTRSILLNFIINSKSGPKATIWAWSRVN